MPIHGTEFNDNGIDKPELIGNDPEWIQGPNGSLLTLGTDTIYGYAGNDRLYGLGADDVLYGGSGEDMLDGGSGKDKLYGGTNNDMLYGDAGNDMLYGDAGDDMLSGGAGNDSLDGGNGADYLVGSFELGNTTEFDTLTGGTQADTFVLGFDVAGSGDESVLYLGQGYATITDFSFSADTIQIQGNFADGYSLELNNWGGTATLDTGVLYKGDLIGVVQDQNITNFDLNEVFSSAPIIFPG